MADTPNDEYVFKRHYRAGARLDLQHYHWRDTVGHLIHPQITLNGESTQVLDVACGTGIWLTDTSRTLPSSAVLVGTDVSLDQCPPKAWLPSNVSLQSWDIFNEPPDNLIGRFDLVHLQLLNFVIKDNELPSTILRVMKTLKRGGWIQWGEYDHPSNTIVKADSGAPSSNFETLLARLRQGVTHPNWVCSLENMFREHGLVSVQSFRHMPPRDHLPSMMNSIFMGLEELIANKDKESARDLEKLLACATTEAGKGVAWTGPRLEVIGRKL